MLACRSELEILPSGACARRGRSCLKTVRSRIFSINLDKRHVTRYDFVVIKTFADKHTEELFQTGKSKRIPPDLIKRAIRRLEYVALATCLKDLEVPPSNRLHPLKGRRKGQYSISVNEQWRICFRFIDGDAYDVEITDYH